MTPYYAIYNGSDGYIFCKTTQGRYAAQIVGYLKADGFKNAYFVRVGE